jgi:hypothetical protein
MTARDAQRTSVANALDVQTTATPSLFVAGNARPRAKNVTPARVGVEPIILCNARWPAPLWIGGRDRLPAFHTGRIGLPRSLQDRKSDLIHFDPLVGAPHEGL